ncbi:MAG: hypothetical protein KJO28_14070, partial [Desulfofustis sp.]|nr:hypothetical protein [Desulfofustis sp.]
RQISLRLAHSSAARLIISDAVSAQLAVTYGGGFATCREDYADCLKGYRRNAVPFPGLPADFSTDLPARL